MRRNSRGGKAGASLQLSASIQPGNFDVLTFGREAHEVIGSVVDVVAGSVGEVDPENRSKVGWPLGFIISCIGAGGNHVYAFEPRFVCPFLVREDILGHSPATKGTIQNVVAAANRLSDARANQV